MAPRALRTIFALPALIALASLMGLVAALVGDGWQDRLSWVTLAVPVVVVGWNWVRRG